MKLRRKPREQVTITDIREWENEGNVKKLRKTLRSSPDDYIASQAAVALCGMRDQESAPHITRLLDSRRLNQFEADDLRFKLNELQRPRPPLPAPTPLTAEARTEAEIERLEKQIRELDRRIEEAQDSSIRARQTYEEEWWDAVEKNLNEERNPLVARLEELKDNGD